jgi:hypothetical protein
MKKLSILALAALLVVAFTVPAAALENEFGGYWRTRFYQMGHFNGEDNDAGTYRLVDTRTRLYYTAKINDNLKLVNKFEMDATWGGPDQSRAAAAAGNRGYGEMGADGANIEIKNSYADFNTGPVNWTVGVQPYRLFRSFFIDDDDAGLIARWPIGKAFGVAGSWLKAYEGGPDGGNNDDIDSYTLSGWMYFSEHMSIKPSVNWTYSSDYSGFSGVPAGELSRWTYGLDFDMDFDNFGLWATAIGQAGKIKDVAILGDQDFKGYLFGLGGNVALGPVDIHTQGFYASGDDDATDGDIDSFSAERASYYWAEILGYGIFDYAVPTGSPGDKITNIWAVNLGTTIKPMDKLSATVDLWYAKRAEDIGGIDPATGLPWGGEDELGTELDVVVTYQLVEGLNLDLVGAYLWAGDAVSTDGNNDKDPYEFGARLSLSF